MSEPDIQIQRDYPQTLVNSQWVKWAAERIAELEAIMADAKLVIERQRDERMKLEAQMAELRLLVAKYMHSEGCGCCEGEGHKEYQEQLGAVLKFPRFKDDSGWDYFAVAKGEEEKL